MKNSPKIAKLIETGEVSAIHEELESSVAYFRMQSMNQSLLALLVHGTISFAEAMKQSSDPEDLQLKLRRMFPRLEVREGEDMPATSDFSQIVELLQFRKLFEEQEEKVKLRLVEKDQEVAEIQAALKGRDRQIEELSQRLQDSAQDREKLRGDYARLRQEAQEKIDKLMERIKELNQRLMGGAADPTGEKKTGIFR
jgi:peptidoglycan hydrolase CwlO-like protein